jgi:hypothetical protein
MAVQEYFMKNRHQLDEIDIIGLEIVPERLGKPEQGQDNTDEVVGHVVGPAGNNKFIIRWLDDSKIPSSHSWSDIGKRVRPNALHGREVVTMDGETAVIAIIQDRQSANTSSKYSLSLRGAKTELEMTWSEISQGMARRRAMDLNVVALGQTGRLENMTCTPCMPVYNRDGDTPEQKGTTRYLAYISHLEKAGKNNETEQTRVAHISSRILQPSPLRQDNIKRRYNQYLHHESISHGSLCHQHLDKIFKSRRISQTGS